MLSMDHLAQDLSIALEETESYGPISLETNRKWGIRRRTRSAGNLYIYSNKSGDNRSEDSSSSNSEIRIQDRNKTKYVTSLHHSDSDDLSLSLSVAQTISTRSHSLRMRNSFQTFIRTRYSKIGLSHSLESDSFNEHSPARPNLRRKRKLKRMSVDETPMPPCGKRKRPQRLDVIDGGASSKGISQIKPLHQTVVDKIEKFCQAVDLNEYSKMETQYINDNCDVISESSLSWSGGEGHEGDDELTDWAPSQDSVLAMDQSSWNDADPREIRAGCRRLRDERPGFSISTGANERVAKFLQDSTKFELRLYGAEREKLGQLASLYSLELWFDGSSSLLRKTNRTPCMQPTQRHYNGHNAAYKKIRTHDRNIL